MRRLALLLVGLALAPSARADEFRAAADNASVACTISAHELTRISLVGDQFASVSKISSGFPYSDFAVSNEPVRGDIYLSVPPSFAANKLSFFATTKKGYVYKFACTIAAIEATQIFVTNPALGTSDAKVWEEQTPVETSAVRLIEAMATGATIDGFTVRQSSARPVRLGDLELQLIAEYRGATLAGKVIRIANRGPRPADLAEGDFAPRDALAVSLGEARLAAGTATTALVVIPNAGADQ